MHVEVVKLSKLEMTLMIMLSKAKPVGITQTPSVTMLSVLMASTVKPLMIVLTAPMSVLV